MSATIISTQPHNALISGPGAWTAADFADPSTYCYRLSEETIRELDGAAARIRESGRDSGDAPLSLTAEDFPLPSFNEDAESLRKMLRTGRGFVVVKGLPIDRYTDDEARLRYWGLGTHLGHPIPQKVHGGLLYSVRDEGYNLERDFGAAGVRVSKTTRGFDFHTDSPSMLAGHTPDVVCLLALQTAKSGGESAIVSANSVHNALLRERPNYLTRLYAPYDVDRRPELPPGQTPTLATPVFAYDGELSVRYLRLYIMKGHEVTQSPLAASDIEPLDYLDSVLRRPELRVSFAMERGDMQFVNNVFILHSRSEYQDYPEPERKRHYVRLWLKHN